MYKIAGFNSDCPKPDVSFKSRVIVKVKSKDKSEFITSVLGRMSELSSGWQYSVNKKNLIDSEFDIFVPPRDCSNKYRANKESKIAYNGNKNVVFEKLGLSEKYKQVMDYLKFVEYEI